MSIPDPQLNGVRGEGESKITFSLLKAMKGAFNLRCVGYKRFFNWLTFASSFSSLIS